MKSQFRAILAAIGLVSSILFPIAVQASTLADIKAKKTLIVGIRQDAWPFGFNEGLNWTGYCVDFADELAESLSRTLGIEIAVNRVQSTIADREALVRSGRVHFECGPNTIRSAKERTENIRYSIPFFLTGTQMLVRAINSNANLGTIAVLQGTTNIPAIQQSYPNARIVELSNRAQGVSDVRNGAVGAFAGDSVLLVGEANRQGLNVEEYTLIPDYPLTCDAYGMILPARDTDWWSTVNTFLITNSAEQIWSRWFTDRNEAIPNYLNKTIQYCQQR